MESLELYRAVKFPTNVAELLAHLADVAWQREEYGKAAECFKESLAAHRSIPLPRKMAVIWCLVGFGRLLAREGKASSAVRLWGAAGRISDEVCGNSSDLREMAERAQGDPQVLEIAWQEGRAMTLEQALTYALEERIDA